MKNKTFFYKSNRRDLIKGILNWLGQIKTEQIAVMHGELETEQCECCGHEQDIWVYNSINVKISELVNHLHIPNIKGGKIKLSIDDRFKVADFTEKLYEDNKLIGEATSCRAFKLI